MPNTQLILYQFIHMAINYKTLKIYNSKNKLENDTKKMAKKKY